MRVHVLCGRVARDHDAIRDYALTLAGALGAYGGAEAVVFGLEGRRWVALEPGFEVADPHAADAVLVQYNPFAFGRWGVAPWLPARLARWGRGRGGPVVGVTVHEDRVPVDGVRSAAMSAWQRAQLAALLGAADVALATCEERRAGLPARLARRVTVVPVGSNLPEATAAEATAAEAHLAPRGANGDRFVLAAFGTGHPSRLLDHVVVAAAAVADARGPVTLLNLGAGAPPLAIERADVEVVAPGPLPAGELAALLAGADLVLLPFVNGAITNRTTLMAALRQGAAVLSTRGPHTDAVLDGGAAPVLVDVADRAGYAAAAAALARDDARRAAVGAAGRALYEREFAWPVIARRTLDPLTAAS